MLIADWSNKKLRDVGKPLTAEHHRLCRGNQPEFAMWLSCPWAVQFNSLCLASPPPPAPRSFSTADFWRSPYQTSVPNNKGRSPLGGIPESTWLALRGAVHTVVITTTCSLDTVPHWLNYSGSTLLAPSVGSCVPARRNTDLQMRLTSLRMSLVSVVPPRRKITIFDQTRENSTGTFTIRRGKKWFLIFFVLFVPSHSDTL